MTPYMETNWNLLHKIRGALPPDTVIGYELFDDEEERSILFVCAYHETPEYFEEDGWIPVTVKDTQGTYYQCDRMGCEMGYYREWMHFDHRGEEKEEKKEG